MRHGCYRAWMDERYYPDECEAKNCKQHADEEKALLLAEQGDHVTAVNSLCDKRSNIAVPFGKWEVGLFLQLFFFLSFFLLLLAFFLSHFLSLFPFFFILLSLTARARLRV